MAEYISRESAIINCPNVAHEAIMAIQSADVVERNEVKTNADRIRNMSDEELLNLLCLKHCPTAIDPAYKCKDIGNCKPCWEEWLKQEVTDGQNG